MEIGSEYFTNYAIILIFKFQNVGERKKVLCVEWNQYEPCFRISKELLQVTLASIVLIFIFVKFILSKNMM